VLAGLVLTQLRSPPPMPREERRLNPGRPLSEIARQPLFIAAVSCGVVSYVIMNLVMTSAPIAMVGCGHSVTQSTLGIQWHVLGMYAPSFITGSLIVRFGVFRIIALGLTLLLASAAISIAGESVGHFWVGLALLGVGWNFAFIGATTLVTRCYRPEERNKVQSFNDFLIFGTMALGSFASGQLLATLGWAFVNATVFPPVLAVAALLAWVGLRQRRGLA
jgi:MFS family permease